MAATTRVTTMHVGPVIAVSDLARARGFYEDQLGLDGSEVPGGWLVGADHGTAIYLLAGLDDAGSASWPLASFRVDDAHATVRALRDRGVQFMGPDDVPFDLDDDGVSVSEDMEVAWMRDPDGSVPTLFSLRN